MDTSLPLAITQNVNPYIPSNNDPWDSDKVQHLFRRISFGIDVEEIPLYLQSTPALVIETIVSDAANLPPTPAPTWGYWVKSQFDASPNNAFYYRKEWQIQTINDLINNGLREMLTLFWSNHFVTEYPEYSSPAYLFQYYNLIQIHAVGNFKEFVREVGLTSAMLIYLNGFQNKKNNPNENYARELYELFTLGENNGYTQTDIEETARALTGWNERNVAWGTITFNPDTFDDQDKTIFQQTGNWGYDDVINILFDQKGDLIANYVCEKFYNFFVGGNTDLAFVSDLAQIFIDNDFEIAPVIETLLKSEHFFSPAKSGVIIKSPTELYIGLHRELNFNVDPNYDLINKIRVSTRDIGQELFNPPDVAGWQGDRSWINSNSFTGRWKDCELQLKKYRQHDLEQLRSWAINIAGAETDPAVVSQRLVDFMLTEPLPNASEYEAITDIFKGDVPQNYFDDGVWNLNWEDVPEQVNDLLNYIIRIPEFQLK